MHTFLDDSNVGNMIDWITIVMVDNSGNECYCGHARLKLQIAVDS